MYGYPPTNEIERRQEAVERMYEREDAELRERIAEERFGTVWFGEHTTKGSGKDDNEDRESGN